LTFAPLVDPEVDVWAKAVPHNIINTVAVTKSDLMWLLQKAHDAGDTQSPLCHPVLGTGSTTLNINPQRDSERPDQSFLSPPAFVPAWRPLSAARLVCSALFRRCGVAPIGILLLGHGHCWGR
jgi:hypothetical protein